MSSGRPDTMIRLDQVSRWYGMVLGLNEVSASFGPGVTGLLGPNGAGKSTLIRILCGLIRPSLGSVRVLDRDPFRDIQVRRRLGLCPETDLAYPRVPALDVLTYLTRLQGFRRSAAQALAGQMLERVGLSAAAHRAVPTYSKGMRQRFQLAQALVHEPDVVVLDEPLNGLDPPSRREVSDLIRALGRAGRCVLVSSHILHEIEAVAERIVVIRAGRVLADGSPRELRAQMPEVPLTVRIQTPQALRLAQALVGLEGVRRIERSPEGLEVLTDEPSRVYVAVAAQAAGGDFPIETVEPTDEDLEAVFRYLTGGPTP